MKKIIVVLLLFSLIGVASGANATVVQPRNENGWSFYDSRYFNYSNAYGAKVFGYNDRYTQSLDIPDTLGGEPVIAVFSYALSGFYNLGRITFPDSLIIIDEGAFYECDNLTSIELPEGLETIGEEAFAYCPRLTQIVIPESVTEIADSAFDFHSADLTIVAAYGSVAWGYALDHDILFEDITGPGVRGYDGNYPDLIVQVIRLKTAAKEYVGNTVHYEACAGNNNPTGTNRSFHVMWYVNGVAMGYDVHAAVPGNTADYDVISHLYFTPTYAGDYIISFSVDCDNEIMETDETNNKMQINLRVY
jgi:hypothetical protein